MMLRDAAALIDKRSPSMNHRANLSDSFNPYDEFQHDSRDDSESINEMRSFLVKKGVDPNVMDDFHAYKVQSVSRKGTVL